MNKKEKLVLSFIAEKKVWIVQCRNISASIKKLQVKQKALKRHIQEADRYIENYVTKILDNSG